MSHMSELDIRLQNIEDRLSMLENNKILIYVVCEVNDEYLMAVFDSDSKIYRSMDEVCRYVGIERKDFNENWDGRRFTLIGDRYGFRVFKREI